jgi:uncharacterized protein YecT (DUF1311 family)
MFNALFLLFLFLMHSAAPAPNNPPPSAKPEPAKPQPCSAAKSRPAANECFANLYLASDAQLNDTYNKIVSSMKTYFSDAQRQNAAPQIAHQQAAMDRLLAAQRAWLNYRDLHCDSVKFQYEGGTLSSAAWSQCMAETTQQRIAALTAAYDLTN